MAAAGEQGLGMTGISKALGAGSVALVALALAGCSSSSSGAAGSPAASSAVGGTSSSSAPASSSPSPRSSSSDAATSSTSLPPLSKFEDNAQVVGVRAYGREYAKAVNAGKKSYGPLLDTLGPTGRSKKTISWMFGTDLKKKLRYPGPLPFTPTRVSGDKVFACVWSSGFATDRKTGEVAETKKIEALQFWMTKNSKGKYVVNGIYSASGLDCSQHNVVGRAW